MPEEQNEQKGFTRRLADGFRALFGRAFNSPEFAVRASHLHYNLFLTGGLGSTRVFGAGELDVCAFFYRYEVSQHHEYEFVTSQRPDADTKQPLQPYALLRLRGEPVHLPSLAEVGQTLAAGYGYGLASLPEPKELLDGLRHQDEAAGFYWFKAPSPAEGNVGFSEVEMLDIIRKELTAPERIAWIEQCFPQTPEGGKVGQRYYIDRDGRIYMLRHGTTKTLFLAQNDDTALQVIWKRTRGAFPRAGA